MANLNTFISYTFYNHFHPYVGELLAKLNKKSIDGLLDPKFHESPELNRHFFKDVYDPVSGVQYFPKEIDVSPEGEGAYSLYNWELFFHVPLTIAVHLSKNQRFADAQRWFHYIFDPTTNDGQFWRFLAFRKDEEVKQIDDLLRLFSTPLDKDLDETEKQEIEEERKRLRDSYEASRQNPFQPHVVARTRPWIAYQYTVVMRYLDNLIAWGDSLFRQDSIETLNEATQIYVLAANLLGPKPQRIPQRGTIQPKTFAQLRSKLDDFGNVQADIQSSFTFKGYPSATRKSNTDQTHTLFGFWSAFYFCIPRNDKLLGYWDTVADRLFKIRHCMNIEGVVRQLPLFQPPIDPGMLVKAAAAGIDISSLVSGLNQPLAPVRSVLLIQKALEICGEVRGLGASLLSALEKRDGEALGLLRQKHEINIQKMAQDVRFLQWKEAESETESLLKNRDSALERYCYYQRNLGVAEEDLKETKQFTLERKELTEENFDEVYGELVGQYIQGIKREDYPALKVIDKGKLYLNSNEDSELNSHLPTARDLGLSGSIASGLAAGLTTIPDADVNLHFWGIGATSKMPIGTAIVGAAKISVQAFGIIAAYERDQAGMASRTASYERRADDWMLQSNLAALELMQIGRQIISSLIREQITQHEYENVKKQIEQSEEIDRFLKDKFTSEQLYGWMQGELSKLYYEYYKFAFDIARKAEQTMKHELMRPELDEMNFIKFNYWDGGRKGLLSGEALHLDLKRMEMAYHDHNKREYELTKHISLRQLNPLALLNLKATGACEVTLPEWLFDMDAPGHYMRRIKNVSLSIPAVTGPYTGINCTLSLLKSKLRRSSILRDGGEYPRLPENEEDTRFIDYYGTIQSIVTSNAQNDSGLFETNLRDERFLPFEGHGVESTWKLELPADFRQFDYDTISDVIIHMRYTARQGGSQLAQKAVDHLHGLTNKARTSGLMQFFSLKHDFPAEWHNYVNGGSVKFEAKLKKEYFPYLVQDKDITIIESTLYAIQDQELQQPRNLKKKEVTKNEKEDVFEISLAEDDSVLQRNHEKEIFFFMRYTISK